MNAAPKLTSTNLENLVAESPLISLPELSAALQDPEHVSAPFWFVRRVFDLAFAVSVLALLAPFFLAICVAIKVDSRGPIFFRQMRVGQRLKWFKILKFRTMYEGVSAVPVAILDPTTGLYRRPRSSEDPRLTRVGRLLRRFSLDELPQVINILAGDMSLIGPRPLTLVESMAVPVDALSRYSVPAGLTGLAQIRNRQAIVSASRFDHDLEYVKTISWQVDAKIFFKTFGRMYDRG